MSGNVKKNPFYKKWWVWIIVIIIIGGIKGSNKDTKQEITPKDKKEVTQKSKNVKSEEEKNKKIKEDKKTETSIKQSSPKEVTETYFLAWKNEDYKSMYEVADPKWKKNNKPDIINAWYDFKTLKSFGIKGEEENNMKIGDKNLIMTKVTVQATYEALKNKDETKTIIVNTVKEEGKWWVNPTSALKED